MENIMKLTLGDWSDDGHGKYEEFYIKSNYDVHKVRQAYKDSCKKTGLSFNHNEDYTGLNLGYGSTRQIWTEYESRELSEDAIEILRKFGIDDYFDDTDDAASLMMKFIALSMPEDFEYEFFCIEAEPINGWWNNELNVQFGYGLFY